MYRVLLVDDEDIEREGMAAIIPWEQLDMELVDMAWNGIEGLEKIDFLEPDIVITDIKMPIMDGIELIRRAKALKPEILFVVLSGYGEYEYTSQAMELGIRHYILKPCDEKKISEVLMGVAGELAGRREKQKSQREYQNSIRRMLPHIKERILKELIQRKELSASDQVLLREFTGEFKARFFFLSVRGPEEFEQLDRFVLNNILTELLGEGKIYLSTAIKKEIIYLIPADLLDGIRPVIEKTHTEYFKYKKVRLQSAVSMEGGLSECFRLYSQIGQLFCFGADSGRELLWSGLTGDRADGDFLPLDCDRVKAAKTYEDLLFEVYFAWVRMEMDGMSPEQMREACQFVLEILFGDTRELEAGHGLFSQVTDLCAEHRGLLLPQTKEGDRIRTVLYTIYENIKNPDLSLQYLAQNVLFMNEDHLGRLFTRYRKEKYSSYLVGVRVSLAQRLMDWRPELKISDLAGQCGYPEDGQYFTKVFKKQTGMVPSEYREAVRQK